MKKIAVYGLTPELTCRCSKGSDCPSPGKHPIGNWRTKPRDPGPDDNVGHPTGREFGYWVLDIDNKPGRDGFATLSKLGKLPITSCVQTGSGGKHYYFRYPEDRTINNSVDKVGPGVDVRGNGGFVVAPPSRHVSGEQYRWETEAPLQAAPDWLLDLVCADPSSGSVTTTQAAEALNKARPEDRYKRAVAYAKTLDPAIEGQGGDAQTWQVAHVGYSFGVGKDRWFQYMFTEYNPTCTPPWTKKDLKTKITNAYKYPVGSIFGWRLVLDPTKTDNSFEFDVRDVLGLDRDPAEEDGALFVALPDNSEIVLAEAFVAHAEEEFVTVNGTLMRYFGCEWLEYPSFDLQRNIVNMLKGADSDVAGKSGTIQFSVSKVQNVANAVRLIVDAESLSEFESRRLPGALSTLDGIVSVSKSGDLTIHRHSPELAGAQHLPVTLAGASSPTKWLELMGRLFEGDECESKTAFIQEFLGAAMTGLATEFDTAIVLHGRGGNGKSTFLNIVERLLFQPSACSTVTPNDMGKEFNLIGLRDALWNFSGELSDKPIRNTDVLKAVISGDVIRARRLHENMSAFRCRAAHIFSANVLPTVSDGSDGFWRRAAVLMFDNNFDGETKRGELLQQYDDERAGVIRWALDGLVSLRKRGHYSMPQSSVDEKADWKGEANPINTFAASCLSLSDDITSTAEVYRQYQAWFDAYSGGRPLLLSMNGLSRKLKSLGYVAGRTRQSRGFKVNVLDAQKWEVNQ